MFSFKSFIRTVAVAVAVSVAFAGGAAAQNVIGGYQAYIGNADLYNSKGVRLSAPWQVIRQDRANYHRFGTGQSGDDWDDWFASADNRAALERWVMNGSMSADARRRIMAGGATIYVEILGYGRTANGVRITVY